MPNTGTYIEHRLDFTTRCNALRGLHPMDYLTLWVTT